MEARFRSRSYEAPVMVGRRAGPSARTLIIVMMALFIACTSIILIVGDLPARPYVAPITGVQAKDVRVQEELVLSSYGWVNKAEGRVRIPIDQAMDIVARDGLPTRAQAQTP